MWFLSLLASELNVRRMYDIKPREVSKMCVIDLKIHIFILQYTKTVELINYVGINHWAKNEFQGSEQITPFIIFGWRTVHFHYLVKKQWISQSCSLIQFLLLSSETKMLSRFLGYFRHQKLSEEAIDDEDLFFKRTTLNMWMETDTYL